MTREYLEQCIEEHKSSYEIGQGVGKNASTVRYYLRKYNLKTNPPRGRYVPNKDCERCGKKKSNGAVLCDYCQVHAYRLRVRLRCIEYKGGKCELCGYDKSRAALHFHHVDPSLKSMEISTKLCFGFEYLKEELNKCLLLCANCHSEQHCKDE